MPLEAYLVRVERRALFEQLRSPLARALVQRHHNYGATQRMLPSEMRAEMLGKLGHDPRLDDARDPNRLAGPPLEDERLAARDPVRGRAADAHVNEIREIDTQL